MAGMTVQLVLQAIDRATAPIAAVNRVIDRLAAGPRAVGAAIGKLGNELGLVKMGEHARATIGALGGVAQAVGTVQARLAGLGAGAAAIGLGGAGAFGLVKGAISYGSEMKTLSERIGMSAESFQKLSFAAEQAGAGPEEFSAAMRALNANIIEALQGNEEAKEAFRAVGISIRDASGKAKDAGTVFLEMAPAFAASTNSAAKTKLSMMLMTGAGAAMIPVLNSGRQAIEQMMGKAENLGLVMGKDAIESADAFGSKLSQVTQVLKATGVAIGVSLIPHLEPLIDQLIAVSAELKPVIASRVSEWFQTIAAATPAVIEGFSGFWSVAKKVGSAIAWLGDTFGYGTTIATALGLYLGGPLVLAVANLAVAMNALGFSMTGTLAKLAAVTVMPVAAAFSNLFTAIRAGYGVMAAFNLVLAANPIGLVIAGVAALAAAATAIYIYWEPISGFFAKLWGGIADFAASAVGKIGELFSSFDPLLLLGPFGIAAKLIRDNWSALSEWFAGVLDATVGRVTRAVKSIASVLPESLRESLGIGNVAITQAPAQALSAAAVAGRAAKPQEVDGQIVIRLEGKTDGVRVEQMRSSGIDLGLDLGPTMVTP